MIITNNLTLAKAVKTDGTHSVANTRGLYLAVRGGSTRWVFRWRVPVAGKSVLKELAIGGYAAKTDALKTVLCLADAKSKADAQAALRRAKLDPRVESKKIVKPASSTFAQDAITYFDHVNQTWESEHYRRDWLASLKNHVFAHIGDRDTASLTVQDIVGVIAPLWGKLATADLILDRIKLIIEHAMNCDDDKRFAERGNPALRVRGRLPQGVQPDEKPHGSMPWALAPDLYSKLTKIKSAPSYALRFLLLCGTPRANEIYEARWSEIRHDEFFVPAERMKSKTSRIIPLPSAACTLLSEMKRDDAGFVFASKRKGKWMGNNYIAFAGYIHDDAMRLLFRKIMPGVDAANGEKWDIHGLRATFRGWVSDHAQSVQDHDAAEIALDHVIGNKVHRAYDRADMLQQRRDLAERWAAFLVANQ